MTLMTIALFTSLFSLLILVLDIGNFGCANSSLVLEDITVDFSSMEQVMEMEYWGHTLEDHAEAQTEAAMATIMLEREAKRINDIVRNAMALAKNERPVDPMDAPPVHTTRAWYCNPTTIGA